MNGGGLTREQVQGWVYNRYYYQLSIPLKDAALMSNCPDREVRREWIQRILDHDGRQGDEGGIEAWLRLGEAVGLERDEVTSLRHVLPGVRHAVDAYVNFARTRPWQESVTASLTEMFAPEIHKERLGHLAGALSLDRRGGLWLLPQAPEGGAPRRRVRAALHAGSLRDARAAGARARHPPVQARRAVVDAGRDGVQLRHRRARVGPERGVAMNERKELQTDRPIELHRQYRFQWEEAQQCHVLLYPEGMVQLQGGAGEIMKRVDGRASLDDIVSDIERSFPGADVRGDVVEFLEVAHGKGWIRTR
jgi:pyrroloquinoline-quinone synthase